MAIKCEICGRKLKATESINAGIGPEYASKYTAGIQAAGSSVARLTELTAGNDPQVNRWLHAAKRAIGAGRTTTPKDSSRRLKRPPFPRPQLL